MKTVKATDAKVHFGELLNDAQREPVKIERNGKAVAVVLSVGDYEEHERLKLERLRQDIALADEDLKAGRTRTLDAENWTEVAEEIKSRGRRRLQSKR